MKNTVFAAAMLVLALVSSVSAQTAAQINATDVNTRRAWCTNQVNMCLNVCNQKVTANACNFNTLAFNCACSNGTTVNFDEAVDLTIPFFTCLNYKWQPCFNACPAGDQPCQDKCNSQYVCGKVKASPVVIVTATASSTIGGSATPAPTNGATIPTGNAAPQLVGATLAGSVAAIAAVAVALL
ncbi:hypothetical protein BC828DRAFT_269283 [Blastocladiella britannica]|nr:hypothetical protein BC828DRAFT_269283 [Blastocladiella britannica]